MKIPYQASQDAQQAYERVKSQVTEEKIAQFQVQAQLTYLDEQKRIEARGTGFDFTMSFHSDHCELELKLAFLLKPLRGKVESILQRELKAVI